MEERMWRLKGRGCFDIGGAPAFIHIPLKVCDRVPCDPQHWPLVFLLLLLLHFEREMLLLMETLVIQSHFPFLASLSFKGLWPEIWCSDLQEEES